MRASGRKLVEVASILAAYLLFLAVGLYAGQTAMMMNVDIISPSEGEGIQVSPVELVAKVTNVAGFPLSDVKVGFTIQSSIGEEYFEDVTYGDGVAKILLPEKSGNYTWYVTATKEGYPRVLSQIRDFSINLSLVVDVLLPFTMMVAASPVDFEARVTDTDRRPVESALVSFYVDSTIVGSSLAGKNGLARLSSPAASGRHTWFASASKGGEGGISDQTFFIVEQPASLVTDEFRSNESGQVLQLCEGWLSSCLLESHAGCVDATMMRSSRDLSK